MEGPTFVPAVVRPDFNPMTDAPASLAETILAMMAFDALSSLEWDDPDATAVMDFNELAFLRTFSSVVGRK